jgi:hypothetical protein
MESSILNENDYAIIENEQQEIDIEKLMKEFNDLPAPTAQTSDVYMENNDSSLIVDMTNYEVNFTIKQLQLICDYYDLSKSERGTKKDELITSIVLFENEPENIDVVIKRKEMWYYMDELKNDPKMKKYVIWK